MEFGKNANIRKAWSYVKLSNEEIEKALDDLIEFNMKVFEKIKKIEGEGFEYKKLIADKVMIASYTYLATVLDQKIEKLKNEPSKSMTPQNPVYKKAEKYAEQKLQEKDETLEKPSLIDEAMKKAEES